MDLDVLFWIALIVFYFLSRALGGSKRKDRGRAKPDASAGERTQSRRPAGERTETRRPAGEPATRPGKDAELEEALSEIRRALGFPREEPQPAREARPESPAEAAPPLADRPERRSETLRTVSEPESELAEASPSGTPPKTRRTEARTRPGRRPGKGGGVEEGRTSEKIFRPRGGIRVPDGAATPTLHPIRASYSEEQAFERLGPHDHLETRPAPRIISPYDAPGKKRIRSVSRRLASNSSLREAFLLKEILDRPISLRRR